MDFYKHLLGGQTMGFMVAGIVFTLLAAILTKTHYYLKRKAKLQAKGEILVFSFKTWINKNYLDFLLSVIGAFVGVRFLDVALHWLSPKMELAFGWSLPVTEDQVFYYFFFGGLVQWWLHNKYKTKND